MKHKIKDHIIIYEGKFYNDEGFYEKEGIILCNKEDLEEKLRLLKGFYNIRNVRLYKLKQQIDGS